MKRIKLTQGKYAIVDNEDFKRVNKYKWYADCCHGIWYAVRNTRKPNGKRTLQQMHRLIMNCPKRLEVDHRNHNGLYNRKCNLRICSHMENTMNRLPSKRKTMSKYKGVGWHKIGKKWVAQIWLNGKRIYLGLYNDEIEAAKMYDAKAKELYGNYAYLNFET